MARLTRYLSWTFLRDALTLFGVAACLLFLVQCLRFFDLVAGQGQSLATLIGQALLGMPGLGIVIFYICLGLGLGRAFRTLQTSNELAIIHINGLVGPLMRAVFIYLGGGVLAVLTLSYIVEPMTQRTSSAWTSSIAADLVSRVMVPHKFASLADGVTLVIGARDNAGNITDFFADDSRAADQRRTYFARAAILTRDEEGYILRLRSGAIQTFTKAGGFSQVAFEQYDLPLDTLTATPTSDDPLGNRTTLEILTSGPLDADARDTLQRRNVEALRVAAICLFVAAVAAFPSGRRREPLLPVELTVLAAAFVERGISSLVKFQIFGFTASTVLLLVASIVLLLIRLRVFLPVRRRRLAT